MYCHLIFSHYRESTTTVSVYLALGISNVVLAIFTVLGNSLVWHALRKCQSLHAPTKALFCSLAFSDLAVGIVAFPLFAVYCFAPVFNNIEVFCAIRDPYAIIAFCLGSVSIFTMTAISLDRSYAFTLKLRYHQFVTYKRVVLLLAGCWILGFIWPFLWLFNNNLTAIVAAVILFCCMLITSISYVKIIFGIRRHQRQVHEQQTITEPQHPGRNHFNIDQYKKSLNTMILIFCLLIACYLPHAIAVVVILVTGINSTTLLVLNITSVVIKLNSLLNPLVYCWKIREIR
ncbi:hypothetical protein ACROYT_G038954, partial [Oculina patagonica]